MAHRTKNKTDNNSTIPLDRFSEPTQISSYIKSIVESSLYDFHEWEAFRVTNVITDGTFERGSVEGQFTVDPTQPILGDVVRPLFGNAFLQVPVRGEQVAVVEFNGRHYYLGVVNTKGQVRENIITSVPYELPDLSPSEDESFERKDIPPIKITEGCTLYEGRFGQSIHFARNKENDAPLIRIGVRDKTGLDAIDDSFDNTDSMILLTSDGEKFSENQLPRLDQKETINGKNIVLKSGDIFIKGEGKIELEAESVVINAKSRRTIKMGDPRAPMLPTVNGEKLLEFQNAVVGILTGINELLISLGGGPAALPKIANDARVLKNNITTVKDSIINLEFLNFNVMTADPNFEPPELPTLDLPELPEVPEIPKVDIPKVPDVSVPEIPNTQDTELRKLEILQKLKK
jgi:hypothetical protein